MRFSHLVPAAFFFCFTCLLLGQLAHAQTKSQTKPFEDQFLSALFNEKFQQELELVEDQKAELRELLGELREKRVVGDPIQGF